MFASQWSILRFNVVFNAGEILTSLRHLMLYFYTFRYTRVEDPYTWGMELGTIFWLLFYPTEVYLNESLDSGKEFNKDYTWDNVLY